MRKVVLKLEGETVSPMYENELQDLPRNSENYVTLHFVSRDPFWNFAKKIVVFGYGLKEIATPIFNSACVIPPQAMRQNTFTISVVGKLKETKLTTNKINAVTRG